MIPTAPCPPGRMWTCPTSTVYGGMLSKDEPAGVAAPNGLSIANPMARRDDLRTKFDAVTLAGSLRPS
jgi:hypothetical protein